MRTSLLLTIATATCLAIAAPAWPCGPPGSMDNGGGQGAGAGQGPSPGDGGGPADSGGGGGRGGDRAGSWDSAGAEGARQGASDQADRDLEGGDSSGPRRAASGSDNANQSADYSNQIGAAAGAQAASDDADCRTLRAQLDELENAPPSEAERTVSKLNASFPRWMQMTPAMLDGEIQAEQARLDAERAADQRQLNRFADYGQPAPQLPKRGSATLNFLYDLRAAKLTGIGVDGMQRRASQAQDNANSMLFQMRAQRDQQIRDLQNRIANNNCPTYMPSASPASSPSPPASPSDNQ